MSFNRLTQILAIVIALVAPRVFGAGNIITATITVTNAPTTNGQTLTVNGNVRTWTNSISDITSQILTNSTIVGSASNLFAAVAAAPFSGLNLTTNSTNGINLQGAPGAALTATVSAGWATVALATNVLTSAQVLRLPLTVEVQSARTNIASNLILAISAAENTNSISQASTAAAQLAGLTNSQTISGDKVITGAISAINQTNLVSGTISNAVAISGNFGNVSNGLWQSGISVGQIMTNGQNFGNPFRSPGGGTGSEQFGISAAASKDNSLAFGDLATASGTSSTAIGYQATATNTEGIAIGNQSWAGGIDASAIGALATASNSFSTAIGYGAVAGFASSTAIGQTAATTASHQVRIGVGGDHVSIPGALVVAGNITNINAMGQASFPTNSDISFGWRSISSLANGNNAAVPVGTNTFVEVSGPSGAFNINGIANGRDGKFLILLNRTGQVMTIANDSGVDATAGNRIYVLSGSDKSVGTNSAALLIYSGSVSRWILLNLAQ